jgi:hypothetical protein
MKPLNTFFGGCENVQNLLGQVNSWFGDKDINQTFLKKTLIFGELRKIFCRNDGTTGVCKLDDLSPYGYNFSICRKECKKSILEGCIICLKICY